MELSGADLRVMDEKDVIVWGKEAAVMKARRMLERILDRNITGRDHIQYTKELEAGDQFSFSQIRQFRRFLALKEPSLRPFEMLPMLSSYIRIIRVRKTKN